MDNRKKNTPRLSILIAAAEADPLAKTGGLGDAVTGLAQGLAGLGHRVSVALPAYGSLQTSCKSLEKPSYGVSVTLGNEVRKVYFLKTELTAKVPAWLIQNDYYFGREGIYGDRFGLFGDNDLRFILFSKSIPELCRRMEHPPDVVIANDWHTGLVPALVHAGALPDTASVFVVHNLGYQGLIPFSMAPALGLGPEYHTPDGLEFYGKLSLIKAGLAFAHRLVTVSPTHAKEIQTRDQGAGLDGLIRKQAHRLDGILNGVDFSVWDPKTDHRLEKNYSLEDIQGKQVCKKVLCEGLEPPLQAERPLMAVVSRLVKQKGLEVFLPAVEPILDMGLNLVVLGSGLPAYKQALTSLARTHAGRMAFVNRFDETLAHRIIAGADLFCMPSLYEPCGLTQMYAMAYGTLPLVRAVGGLADTVRESGPSDPPGTGFVFWEYGTNALLEATKRALSAFREKEKWRAMQNAAMGSARRFTWGRAAREYEGACLLAIAEAKHP